MNQRIMDSAIYVADGLMLDNFPCKEKRISSMNTKEMTQNELVLTPRGSSCRIYAENTTTGSSNTSSKISWNDTSITHDFKELRYGKVYSDTNKGRRLSRTSDDLTFKPKTNESTPFYNHHIFSSSVPERLDFAKYRSQCKECTRGNIDLSSAKNSTEDTLVGPDEINGGSEKLKFTDPSRSQRVFDSKFTTNIGKNTAEVFSLFDSYLLADTTAITIRLYDLIIHNIEKILHKPYWSKKACDPMMKNLSQDLFSILDHIGFKVMYTNSNILQEYSLNKETLRNYLLYLKNDSLVQKTFYYQKLKGENMRFLSAFTISDKNKLIDENSVPVVIIGIISIKDITYKKGNDSCSSNPLEDITNFLASLDIGTGKEKTLRSSKNRFPDPPIFKNLSSLNHSTPKLPLTIDPLHEYDVFENFNQMIKEVENKASSPFMQSQTNNDTNIYAGPEFNIQPIAFTDHSQYRWELVTLDYIFRRDDPVLRNLPAALKSMDSFLSIPNSPDGEPLLVQPVFQSPDYSSILYSTIKYYTPSHLNEYLKTRILGDKLIIRLNDSNQRNSISNGKTCITSLSENMTSGISSRKYPRRIGEGERCSICLSEYKEGDMCLNSACHHLFHVSCINLWMDSADTNKCPICRTSIRMK